MDEIIIKGGTKLCGKVQIAGAKNAALPILAATLLPNTPSTIYNLPHLQDVAFFLNILGSMGIEATVLDDTGITLDPTQINSHEVPQELVKVMRASILMLGPMVAKFGKSKIALPGGCSIGARPIDLHVIGLEALGVEFNVTDSYVEAFAPNGLIGNHFHFDIVSVTATENILMAATLAKGETVLTNAACEPEIFDLANYLTKMGAKIDGIGTSTLTIHGVEFLHGECWHVIPDRIEAGTYLVAAAATRGCVTVCGVLPWTMTSVLQKLEHAGAFVSETKDSITVDMRGKRVKATDITTAVYPDFPTDMQAQFVVLNAIACGNSKVVETIFENRFMHALELKRMGANIILDKDTATICGVELLQGTKVKATDLRASAALIIAGIAAQGETIITHVSHVDRGYDYIEEKMQKLGADIRRVSYR